MSREVKNQLRSCVVKAGRSDAMLSVEPGSVSVAFHTFAAGGGGPRRRRRAFSLIELLTVMGLIVILMGLILGAGVFARGAALRARARADVERMHNALQEYRMQYRKFDPSSSAWKGYPYPSIGTTNATSLRETMVTNWLAANFTFVDPWRRPYQYLYDTNAPATYTLYSFGAKAEISEDDLYSGR